MSRALHDYGQSQSQIVSAGSSGSGHLAGSSGSGHKRKLPAIASSSNPAPAALGAPASEDSDVDFEPMMQCSCKARRSKVDNVIPFPSDASHPQADDGIKVVQEGWILPPLEGIEGIPVAQTVPSQSPRSQPYLLFLCMSDTFPWWFCTLPRQHLN